MKTSVINQIKTLLGMEVKLEQRKMADGVTLIEADAFEMDNEVFVITEDEQKYLFRLASTKWKTVILCP